MKRLSLFSPPSHPRGFRRGTVTALLATAMVALGWPSANGMELKTDLDEVIQTADAVFVGKVLAQECRYGTKGKMIFTDVKFALDQWVGGRVASPVKSEPAPSVSLTFAGGKIGEDIVKVTGVPALEDGKTYVVFTRMDGQVYASPLIAGVQGLFPVIEDDATGQAYPLTFGSRYIAGFTERDYVPGSAVTGISAGQPLLKPEDARFTRVTVVPQAVAGPTTEADSGAPLPSARVSVVDRVDLTAPPISLEEFVTHIKSRLAASQPQP